MPYEIERKFLVRDETWRAFTKSAFSIQQGYLARSGSATTRVRIIDRVRALLTIKSAASGIRRLEFEYDIPMQDAVALIDLRQGGLIEKRRHKLPWDCLTWEIDVFEGDNHGLVIAEIELPHEDQTFEKPAWLGREVTSDPRYSNAGLAETPFRRWPESWRRVHLIEPGYGDDHDGQALQAQGGRAHSRS
jgi:adenylate cyclase